MSELTLRSNPYVGLRPFFTADSLYFFGRTQQTAELLEILHEHRFLGVVGSSGSGKSSLLRAGLLPKLLGGFLAHDRDRWRVVHMKPGDAPIGNLARALADALEEPPESEVRGALEQRIRDDHTDAVAGLLHTRLEANANLFLLVDQFEEIFAFRGRQDDESGDGTEAARWKERARRRAEAADFIDLLLGLAALTDLPIYVALTMRTDFLGDCDLFYGLPEALNRGRYLVPRLTRQQLREAIEGPALLLRTGIEPRLMDYLLNELGDRFDRLPVLQHALLRTWDAWRAAGGVGRIDFAHYEAAGRLAQALDRDAEGALGGLDLAVTAAVFKRLTDTDERQRRVRSPARVSELAAAAGAERGPVAAIVQRFAENGRSFVYTSDEGTPDDPRVDIAHESLIRQWNRLGGWVDAERQARDRYRELVERARKREQGEAALLQDPELRSLSDWRDAVRPTPAWAARYGAEGDFDRATAYLDASIGARCQTLAEAELARRWKIWNALILLVVMVVALFGESVMPRSGRDASLSGTPVEGGSGREASALGTTRISDLDWTVEDRGRALDWPRAGAYCDDLVAAGRSDWRLPSSAELLDLYDPGHPTPAGLKLRDAFHRGVTARWIWTGEAGDTPSTALAADFEAGLFVPLAADFTGGARALCVTSPPPAGRAAELASKSEGVFARLRRHLPLGILVLAYVVFAWIGRRVHRRVALPRILSELVATGGRDPREASASAAEPPAAPDVHHTTYASTLRRMAAYAIDMTVYVVCLALVMLVIGLIQDAPVAVTLPSGERVEGIVDFERTDDQTVWLTTADGTERSFPQRRDPVLEIIGGVPVPVTLPTGQRVQGRSFDRLQVAVTLPSEERVEGTVDEMDGTHVSLTTADGANRSFVLDPNAPRIDIAYPPSDGALIGFVVFALIFGWLYETLPVTSLRGATPGMRLAGIFRTDLHGGRLSLARASAWYGYRLLSYLAYGLGFVSQPFTKRRQAFHDWMAGSVVLRRPPRPGAST